MVAKLGMKENCQRLFLRSWLWSGIPVRMKSGQYQPTPKNDEAK
jgi:hypothetical protein